MNDMIIENPKYFCFPETTNNIGIVATIDGVTMSVPLDENNRHYAEILRQVAAGTLVIQDAE